MKFDRCDVCKLVTFAVSCEDWSFDWSGRRWIDEGDKLNRVVEDFLRRFVVHASEHSLELVR